MSRKRLWTSLALALVCSAALVGRAEAATITLNGAGGGENFDGMGTITAGGESRLIRDYPSQQLGEIFDYMFCSPLVSSTICDASQRYGASPSIFKVEIGGDTNSSVGAEPSFIRSQAEYDAFVTAHASGTTADKAAACHIPITDDPSQPAPDYWGRGYTWRLMRAAALRNPQIQFSALPWGAPGWIGGGQFYTSDMISYDLAFAYCAYLNGTPLTYLGIWNETPYRVAGGSDFTQWIIDLKNALAGYTDSDAGAQAAIRSIQVVAADDAGSWDPLVSDMTSNATLRDAVDAIGVHYVGYGAPAAALALQSTYGKKLWISEQGPLDYNPDIWSGARALAQLLTNEYIQNRATSVQIVGALAGYYDPFDGNFPNPSNGMLYANSPWSGHYDVLPAVWVMGHVGQFTQGPDASGTYRWRYVDGASCVGSGSCADGTAAPAFTGSYTSFRQVSGTGWTTVVETSGASGSQTFQLCPSGGLAAPASIQIWDSSLTSGSTDAQYFVHTSQAKSGSCYSVTVAANHVYTLTTLTTGNRVLQSSSANRPIDRPDIDPEFAYRDYPGTTKPYRIGDTPKYFSDTEGAFQIGCGPLTGESTCLSQVVDVPPINWGSFDTGSAGNGAGASTIVGAYGGPTDPPGGWLDNGSQWCDYSASIGVRVNENQYAGAPTYGTAGTAALVIRTKSQYAGDGYQLLYAKNVGTGAQTWHLLIDGTEVANGNVTAAGDWHILDISVSGSTVTASVDGSVVTTYTDPSPSAHECGWLGLRTGWNTADFDVLDIRSGA